MDNEVRELLRDIAKDIPPQHEVPPTLRPRARRRIVATVGVTMVVVGALALGSVVAARSIMELSDRPADVPNNVQLPDDPEAWQRIVLPGGPPGCLDMGCTARIVAAGDAGLVAVGSHYNGAGEDFVGWSSPDGLSWHQIEGNQNEGDGLSEAEGLAAGGPGFVAARQWSIFTSTDGVSWDRVQSIPVEQSYYSVAAGGPGVVAVGSNRAWYSSDGLMWAPATVSSDVHPSDNGKASRLDMTEVAAGAGGFVATGSNYKGTELTIWVSSDGTSWRDVPIDGQVFSLDCRITDVAGASGGFVAVGWCGDPGHESDYLMWRSDDGVNWSRVGKDRFEGGAPRDLSVGASPTGFIAAGDQSVWTSVDGESWTHVPWPAQGAGATDVTAWGSRLVVVGVTDDDRNVVWISGPQQ